ncbi:MAG: (d)CMP kinase [Candidatus Omnitrophica bacterium]|nr:(d)CMP kinase [Candidatus Omnitrophota bacterium]
MIIAIDGPAGSGKTTVARLLAKRLGISYLDTGAIYRVLTYLALERKIGAWDEEALTELAKILNLDLKGSEVYLDGVDLSEKIRTPQIDKSISAVVSHPEVRKVIVELQRKIVEKGDFVVEGRDITTVVFPDTEYKFYLDADPNIRAERRSKELQTKGVSIELSEVQEDLEKRDYADKNREVGALKKAPDAFFIDTSNLTIEQSVEEIAKHIQVK